MDGACIAWDSLEGWDGVRESLKRVAGGCIMSSQSIGLGIHGRQYRWGIPVMVLW